MSRRRSGSECLSASFEERFLASASFGCDTSAHVVLRRLPFSKLRSNRHVLARALDLEIEASDVERMSEQPAELTGGFDLLFFPCQDDVAQLEQVAEWSVGPRIRDFQSALVEGCLEAVISPEVGEAEQTWRWFPLTFPYEAIA